jgi:MauM/NapG family ferredoxin protein
MRFQQAAQAASLAIFLMLLAKAGHIAGSDIFLQMDPAMTAATALAAQTLAWIWLPAIVVIVSAFFFGRIFCGHICPMGTTIDTADRFVSPKPRPSKEADTPLLQIKYYVLAFVIGSALMGVTFVFWAAPLSLITRFYGLVIYPVVLLLTDYAVSAFYPVASHFDIRTLMFLEISPPKFATGFFVLVFFAAVFAAARISPRFWCRYICPSGAILALAARKPVMRRQVTSECNQCGMCARYCPMGAIDPEKPEKTNHSQCIVCKKCAHICPKNAVLFSTNHQKNNICTQCISPGRRQMLLSGLAGAGTAAVTLTGLTVVAGDQSAKGAVRPQRVIRPPGALPEPQFLSACIRCGNCMAACPTNTLQPLWFDAGLLGIFSPAVIPRKNFCDPLCTACGNACPTAAIQILSQSQRPWAKIGTAVIFRQQCLAWEYKKSCMVCDEVCPYDAVEFEKKPDLPYPVPHVIEDRCAGCGHCEHACPVYNQAAIVVTPMNALRLGPGMSFESEAKTRGFSLKLHPKDPAKPQEPFFDTYSGQQDASPFETNGTAPGFDEGG